MSPLKDGDQTDIPPWPCGDSGTFVMSVSRVKIYVPSKITYAYYVVGATDRLHNPCFMSILRSVTLQTERVFNSIEMIVEHSRVFAFIPPLPRRL